MVEDAAEPLLEHKAKGERIVHLCESQIVRVSHQGYHALANTNCEPKQEGQPRVFLRRPIHRRFRLDRTRALPAASANDRDVLDPLSGD